VYRALHINDSNHFVTKKKRVLEHATRDECFFVAFAKCKLSFASCEHGISFKEKAA